MEPVRLGTSTRSGSTSNKKLAKVTWESASNALVTRSILQLGGQGGELLTSAPGIITRRRPQADNTHNNLTQCMGGRQLYRSHRVRTLASIVSSPFGTGKRPKGNNRDRVTRKHPSNMTRRRQHKNHVTEKRPRKREERERRLTPLPEI